MNVEESLGIIEQALSQERLSKLQLTVFRQAWEDLSYQEIAKISGYEVGYVKQAGSQLWQLLSKALGQKVSKNNLQFAVKQYARKEDSQQNGVLSKPKLEILPTLHQDWGEAIDVSVFYGRTAELETLQQWILGDQCRLVGLFGMGGIGKTSLSVKLAKQIQGNFEFVIWRSLRNAPPLQDLLADLIQVLSPHQEALVPDTSNKRLLCLLESLRQHRCLLIFDNLETLMEQGDRSGNYQSAYEDYGQLLRCLGETQHRSCVVITSREKPKGIAIQAALSSPIRSLQLTGLPLSIGQAIFQLKGDFSGSTDEWKALIEHYAGNPLALKMVAGAIADFFNSSVTQFLEFLQQGNSAFGDIRDLLAGQVYRLSDLEQHVMYWLAINRKPVSFAQLQADFVDQIAPSDLLEAVISLERRSLIEKAKSTQVEKQLAKKSALLTLQPVVMEYMTTRLIEQACEEVTTSNLHLMRTHALIKAQAKDYLRETQTRLILKPVADRLLSINGKENLDQQLMSLLPDLRDKPPEEVGYVAGNVLNLLSQLNVNLQGRDFSRLTVRQAYLRKINLHQVDFAQADLAKSVFTETFSQILSVAFSPDSKLLAASDVSYEIHVWRVADGKKLFSFKAEDGWVWSIAFSPDGQVLASTANGSIHLWDLETGQCQTTLQEFTSRIFSLVFSPDGSLLASGSEDQLVKIWDVKTGQLLQTLEGHTDEVHAVVFAPDASPYQGLVASGSYDGTVRLWNPQTGACLKVLRGHTQWIWSVAFSPDGQVLASSSSDRTIRLWDCQTEQCCQVLLGHTQPIRSIHFSVDGQTLASGSDDQTIRLWSRTTGECFRVLQGHSSWISSVVFSPDGSLLASGSEDQSVRLWDSRTHHCLRELQGHNNGVWSVAYAPASGGVSPNPILASGGQDRMIRLWHSQTGEDLGKLEGHTSWVWSIALDPKIRTLASGSEDGTVRLWDIDTRQPRQILHGHTHPVWSVVFNPNGKVLASGSLDGAVKLWSVATGKCQNTFKGHTSGVWSVAFSPDGTVLATGGQDQTVILWDVVTGRRYQILAEHEGWIRCVAFSPDGKTLVSGGSDGLIKLWEVSTGKCYQTLQAHTSLVLAAAYSPDGTTLATSGGDATVKLWQVDHQQAMSTTTCQDANFLVTHCWKTLKGHQNWVRFLAYSPDSKVLASCSQDGAIRLWATQIGECFKTLRVPRPYEGMNIKGARGLTEAQIATLQHLGALEASLN